mmetsp:Transcript_18765/g.28853  ORF Transcript_18765/g.28853 Transcript_18765/m.28853 type:complete len:82 (+) Transcript_18765:576-821(+)|eukprot:CAMPEP_0170482864 /NCGR_PEP_ID=MMETSP0208-20121228/2692_1 /TAXON_ID=197538 /ORGANISM="Strombidium inclinatum, Strain S3" /LENGTH=81 /DNA_ID=CAMNT_0010755743 /DNA_START=559 /DNA_END=804 /DNA_ORIENTATION=+
MDFSEPVNHGEDPLIEDMQKTDKSEASNLEVEDDGYRLDQTETEQSVKADDLRTENSVLNVAPAPPRSTLSLADKQLWQFV